MVLYIYIGFKVYVHMPNLYKVRKRGVSIGLYRTDFGGLENDV
jgi:hypothetical protein